MTPSSRIVLSILALALLLAPVAGQTVAPLIREERSGIIRRDAPSEPGKPTPTPSPTPEPDKPVVIATPTPDPELVLVAIVNSHAITRAQLDRRVSARMGGAQPAATPAPGAPRAEQMRTGGVALSDSASGREILENLLIADQQAMEVGEAVRAEESFAVQQWVEQMMLADEARRQGIMIPSEEFQLRVKQIEAEFRLRDPRVERLLAAMGMDRAEFESHVHDALLVEKLCDRWVSLHLDDEDLRRAYNAQPSFYRTPARYRAAHFTIVLMGDEGRAMLADMKKLADRVRGRLAKGESHDKVFEDVNDLEFGIFGADLGYFTLEADTLHPLVQDQLKKMKPGQTSGVLEALTRIDGQVVPEAYHVVRLLDYLAPQGDTFESALPKLRENSRELARTTILEKLREARTHRVITNLGGIPPHRVPSLVERSKARPPIDLATAR
jgi:hypothetical protein